MCFAGCTVHYKQNAWSCSWTSPRIIERLGLEGTLKTFSFQPLDVGRVANIRSGTRPHCPGLHPTWPRAPPVMGHPCWCLAQVCYGYNRSCSSCWGMKASISTPNKAFGALCFALAGSSHLVCMLSGKACWCHNPLVLEGGFWNAGIIIHKLWLEPTLRRVGAVICIEGGSDYNCGREVCLRLIWWQPEIL